MGQVRGKEILAEMNYSITCPCLCVRNNVWKAVRPVNDLQKEGLNDFASNHLTEFSHKVERGKREETRPVWRGGYQSMLPINLKNLVDSWQICIPSS